MPTDQALRIYCLCGQKMKVTPDMYGKPGKCVACRMRIRVPHAGEIPEGTDELYLRDHPEFIRKRARPSRRPEVAEPEESAEGLPLGASEERASALPLDSLAGHRRLCSLAQRVDQELAVLERGGKGEAAAARESRERLLAYRAVVKQARAEFDEALSHRLIETAGELSRLQEEAAQAALSARMGELAFTEYQGRVDRIRRRRETLERYQQNLRGWLIVQDAYTAGGLIDVAVDADPYEDIRVPAPAALPRSATLFGALTELVKEALGARERAESKLEEAKRLIAGGAVTGPAVERLRAETEAAKRRTDAAVRFGRQRLAAIQTDVETDLAALDTQLDTLAAQVERGTLSPRQARHREAALRAQRRELARMETALMRAQSANSPHEVPRAAVPRPPARGLGSDAWCAWAAAALLLVCPMLPALGALAPVRAYREAVSEAHVLQWTVLFPVVLAVVLAFVPLLPGRGLRGLLHLALGGVGLLAGAVCLHLLSLRYSFVGQSVYAARPWVQQPGVVCYVAAILLLFTASWLALRGKGGVRALAPIALILSAAAALALLTGLGGFLEPRPVLTVAPEAGPVDTTFSARYVARIGVANGGWVPLVLGREWQVPAAYGLDVAAETGNGEWTAVEPAALQMAGGGPVSRRIDVAPGARIELACTLGPGRYRVTLTPAAGPGAVSATVELTGSASLETARASHEAARRQAEADALARQQPPTPATLATLTAIMSGSGREPQFTIDLSGPGDDRRRVVAAPGTDVYGGWLVREFSMAQQTVTLERDGKLLILRQGADPVPLPEPETE